MVALMVGGVLTSVVGPSASASSPWVAATLPPIASGPSGSFETSPAVSCSSATSCVAVGTYVPVGVPSPSLGGGVVPFADVLSGATWTSVVLPVPPGGSEVSLSAVSCSSSMSCVAVGQYSPPGGGVRPLAETLAAGAWTATVLPLPPKAYFTSLSPVPLVGAVSCSSPLSCVAVGVYPVHKGRSLACCYSYFPLVETLVGTAWSAATGPTPTGADNASLSGVSCSSAAACVAVGNDASAVGAGPLVEELSGRTWRAAPLPLPTGDSYPGYFPWTVSCGNGTCLAFGADVPSGSAGGLVADTLSDGGWTPTRLTLPAGGSDAFPFTYEPQGQVSCSTTQTCVAVSGYQQNGVQGGVALTLAGGAWSAVPLPAPPGGSLLLPQSVSCPVSSICMAVGNSSAASGGQNPLSEALSGTTWTSGSLPIPPPTPYASLTALSCPSPSACVAVGDDFGADHAQRPMAEMQSGSHWTSTALRLPAGTGRSGDATPLLQGLSCPSTGSCVAVGYAPGPALSEHPLAEVLAQGTWVPERLPMPTGFLNQSASLSSVSCVSATSCVAVGALSSERVALVESLTAAGWTATAVAPPGDLTRVWLSAVSCPSSGSCVAVGAYWGSSPGFSRPLSATLSGTTWHTAEMTLPPDARDDVAFTVPMLRSVACTSTTSCTAVGFYPTSFDATTPVVETLSGSTWTPVPLSSDGANWTLLWGLSCPSASSCVAVGEASGLPLVATLASGTWSATAVTLPAGDNGAALQAVSRGSPHSCTAVGGGTGVSGTAAVVASPTTDPG